MYLKTLTLVFGKPLYSLLFLVVSLVVLTIAIMMPSVGLLHTLWQYDSVSVLEIVKMIVNLYGSLGTNFTPFSATSTVLIACLFGLQIALLTYYIRSVRGKAMSLTSVGTSSIGGLVSGFFGIGCAACGSFLLSSILVLFGAGGVLAWLPFGGEEFGLLGVGLLLYANHLMVKKINAPLLCST